MSHACYVCNFYPVPDGEGAECPHCHRFQYGTACPKCHQNAPTIIRNMRVYCSSCGAERGPLNGMPMNMVGQGSRVGSTVTRVAGWGVIISGIMVATILGLLFGVFGSLGAGLTAAAVIGGIGVFLGMMVLRGSRALRESGDTAQRHVREQAIFALASHRGGMVTAMDVAGALNIQLTEADAMLTAMAREGSRVSVDIDAAGVVHYVFSEVPIESRPMAQVRVEGHAPSPGVRVATDAPATPQTEQERIRETVDREYEQMRKMSEAAKRNPH